VSEVSSVARGSQFVRPSVAPAALPPAGAVDHAHRLAPYLVCIAIVDVVTIGWAVVAAYRLRFSWPLLAAPGQGNYPLVFYAIAIGGLWIVWLLLRGAYSTRVFGSGSEEFKRIVLASFLAGGTVGLTCYLAKFDLSRGFVALTFLIGLPAVVAGRYLSRKVLHRLRRTGRMLHRVIALGAPEAVAEVVDVLDRERYVGYEVVGACVPEMSSPETSALSVPVLGVPERVRAACAEMNADTVVVAGGAFSTAADVRRVVWGLEGSHVDLVVIPSLIDVAGPRIHFRPVAGLPLIHVEPPQAEGACRWGKRAFDLLGASVVLLLSLPVMLAVVLAIKLDDRGPALFRQERVGRRGKVFPCFKFRSMSTNAEERLLELLEQNLSDGVMFKMRTDPRVTRVGRWIRRFSLDELPQLLNVLRGDMSLVGPRPPLPREVDRYGDDVGRRLMVRPGMTGLWQVSGRSALSWRETVRLDLYYVDNWSMVGDMVILARTLRAVLSPRGAY
jgi:exopolysaccharide biosynthesis polyprenyl glycosylphosphotransferase